MNVRQLIALLEKVEDKERLVYVKNGQTEGSCCNSGDYDWEEASAAEEHMVQERVWDPAKKRLVLKSINVVKIDTY